MTTHDASDDSPKRSSAAPEDSGQSLYEKVVPDGVRRGVESLLRDGRLKHLVGEMKLPKEIVSHMISQMDETKQAAVSAIGREVRLFLEKTSLADELAKLLTQVSFQIKTEIRFVPTGQTPAKTDAKKRKSRPSLWPLRPIVHNEVQPSASSEETDDGSDENTPQPR